MVSILIGVPDEQRQFALAELLGSGTLGCSEEAGGLRAFFADRAAAEAVQYSYPVLSVREEPVAAETGTEDEPAEPILVGERFCIATGASAWETPAGRLRLVVDAGPAFGTGRHESTQLMIEAIEKAAFPGMRVADVGCGSGILSQAALLLGAGQVAACDIDPVFLGCLPDALKPSAFVGSADGIRTQTADLVLANISAKVIDRIAYDLNRIAKPGGVIVLSGFIDDRIPQCFTPLRETRSGDWLCWVCQPSVDINRPAGHTTHSLDWY